MATRAEAVPRPVRGASFHFYVAILFVTIAFVGFARTYLIPIATGRFEGAAILHLHGALFLAWTVLFAVQSRLVERRRIEWHRALGVTGVSLGTAMLFTGLALVVRALDYGLAIGNDAAARPLAIVPVSQISLFAAFVAVGVANVRKPETHKRLMLLATASLLPAAVARVLLMILRPDFSGLPNFAATPVADVNLALTAGLVAALLVDLIVVAAMLRDWRLRGRPHPAYAIGLGCIVAVQVGRIPFAHSDVWHAVTDVLAALSA